MIPIHDFNITPKSNMVICSFGNGQNHSQGLRVMKPTVEYYGKRHKIDTFFLRKSLVSSKEVTKRNKIVLLYNLLKYYEIVMWIDSDAMFVNFHIDIRDELQTEHVIYMATHFGRDPLFPNSGIIVAKRDPMTFEILEEVWKHKWRGWGWWDQQAFLNILGFKNKYHRIKSYDGPTKYTSLIGKLDDKWNSRPYDKDVAKKPLIMHYCGFKWDYRLNEMNKQLVKFQNKIRKKKS